MVKDLDFATAAIQATDTHPALLPAVRAVFAELTRLGLGEYDIAVTRRHTELRRPLSEYIADTVADRHPPTTEPNSS